MPGYMRLKVKTGCNTCKRRKKKCDEGKPACANCLRIGLPCSYGRSTASTQHQLSAVVFDLDAPQIQTGLLPITHFEPHEPSIIARVPSSVLRFMCPTVAAKGRDLSVLMQLVIVNSVVRDAVVSCFSAILPDHNHELGHFSRRSYGSAIRQVRQMLVQPESDCATLSSLQIAIQFLGLIECAGPQQSPDQASHWIALAWLAGRVATTFGLRSSPLPRSLNILIWEAILYNFSTLVLFQKDLQPLNQAYQECYVVHRLREVSPLLEDSASSSPLLGGEYELWRLAFEVIVHCRSPEQDRPSKRVIARKKEIVRLILSDMENRFAACSHSTRREQQSMEEIYGLHCIGLLIMFGTLEVLTPEVRRELEDLTAEGVRRFSEWQLISMTYSPATWSLHVLAGAISRDDHWEVFNAKLVSLQQRMDTGHLGRLESLLAQVTLARAFRGQTLENVNSDGLQLPGSLFLFHQPEGVLHDWLERSGSEPS